MIAILFIVAMLGMIYFAQPPRPAWLDVQAWDDDAERRLLTDAPERR